MRHRPRLCFGGSSTALGETLELDGSSVNLRRDLGRDQIFQLESLILAQNERWRQA